MNVMETDLWPCELNSRPKQITALQQRSKRRFSLLRMQVKRAGIGVTLIPEMAVGLETSSAQVSIAQFEPPEPTRLIGMVWRKASPLAKQLMQISEIVLMSANTARRS